MQKKNSSNLGLFSWFMFYDITREKIETTCHVDFINGASKHEFSYPTLANKISENKSFKQEKIQIAEKNILTFAKKHFNVYPSSKIATKMPKTVLHSKLLSMNLNLRKSFGVSKTTRQCH